MLPDQTERGGHETSELTSGREERAKTDDGSLECDGQVEGFGLSHDLRINSDEEDVRNEPGRLSLGRRTA